ELFTAPDAVLNLLLLAPPFGDVEKRDHRTDHFAVAEDRMTPIFGRKRRTVGTPEDLVVHVRALAVPHRFEDRRLLRRVGGAVGLRVVNQRVHLLADERGGRIVAQRAGARAVAEDTGAA